LLRNKTWTVAALVLVLVSPFAPAQKHGRKSPRPAPSTSLIFLKRDRSCITGPISVIDPKTVTVSTGSSLPVKIARADLLQASQNNSLVFSARSSWVDLQAVHLRAREEITFKLRSGKIVKGVPLQVTADSINFKFILWTKKRYPKRQILTVDYLRQKPNSAAFDTYTQESPATMLFFYPELYDQWSLLVDRIPVRLYDVLKPEDNSPLHCP
jgi:hypothetical protein